MNPSFKKVDRLLQIEALLLAHPQGLTQAELARRLEVNRSTIGRYIPHLPKNIYIDDLDGGKWKIDRSAYLVQVRFNLHEATALHLASRLLANRLDKQNPHAAAALRKLGLALNKLAPHVSQHILTSADQMDDQHKRLDPNFISVLETLTLAWAEQKKVSLWHRNNDFDKVYQYTFSPYFVEPYAAGNSLHVIGYREPPGKVRTFKIERIEQAKLLNETYQIPVDFDPTVLLSQAWGIWYSEKEPVQVRLRFSQGVSRRVLENQWHIQEETELQPDGSLIWQASIAEPLEMLPWIRGWGADVEVLAPEGLRNVLIRETYQLSTLYETVSPVTKKTVYYAHSKERVDESNWQKLKDHLLATSELAAKLGKDAGISELSRVAGLFHDIGKYSRPFQDRLRGAKTRVDHATAGAKEVMTSYPNLPQNLYAELISYCIAGHHSGLPDYGTMGDMSTESTLLARREKRELKDYSAYKEEWNSALLEFQPPRIKINSEKPGFSISFLTRMIFSTLVDADWLETENYMGERGILRGKYASIPELAQQFNNHLRKFENPETKINQKRSETLKVCINQSISKPGFFSLTIPTGGGKTMSSMAFALNHAVKHDLKRIIYVIPFTSIIDQNADEFRKALGPLGNENVLEHHSNFDWERIQEESDDDTNSIYQKLKLAAENWDIPIIVTTNVQFFESLFSNKKRMARKLHNLAKSVIIFDEVQMLPREYLQPCMTAVYELVRNYGVSTVFCTATQPSLQRFLPKETVVKELIPNSQELFEFYRRLQVTNLGVLADPDLLEQINRHEQVLCIVNTRRHAKGLFEGVNDQGRFHLSTLMCPAHRREVLSHIRTRLKEGLSCRVVSTQVMEAGIDVDFPVGYRAMAGLDSIIQAAGRVNREGKQTKATFFVFEPKTEFIKRTPIFIRQTAAVAQSILRNSGDDPTGIEAIEAYYNMLYNLQVESNFDVKGILRYLSKGANRLDFDFKTASENFKLIENVMVSVIIPYDNQVKSLLQELEYTAFPSTILRKLQIYTVNIYLWEFEVLQTKGVIQIVGEKYNVLDEAWMKTYYKPETGLIIPDRSGGEAIFFD